MHRRTIVFGFVLSLVVANAAFGQDHYFPERRNWEERAPGEAGMDAGRLQAAIDFAVTRENPATMARANEVALARTPNAPLTAQYQALFASPKRSIPAGKAKPMKKPAGSRKTPEMTTRAGSGRARAAS